MQKLYSVTEAAKYLGLSRQTIYALMKKGRFPKPTATNGRREAPLFDYESLFQLKSSKEAQT